MKKILIYGGSINAIQMLEVAKEMGLKVGVIDYNETSDCKDASDYSYCVDVFDINNVVRVIEEEKYDGVITGYSEQLLQSYAQVCDKSEKKCYGSTHLFDLSTNKLKFKQLCKKYGVPVMHEFELQEVQQNDILYPVVVKPSDSAASIGVKICYNYEDFQEGYRNALKVSKSKKIIIEKCAAGREATFFYYFCDGIAYFTAYADKITIKQLKSDTPMPVGYIFPGKIQQEEIKKFNTSLFRLFKNEGFKNGMAFAQTFIEKDGIYLCEIGYRLTPSFETFVISALNNFNPIKEMIKYSIGQEQDVSTLTNVNPYKGYAANITILLKPGIIKSYENTDKIEQLPYVQKVLKTWEVGHTIEKAHIGTLSQVGLRVIITADSEDELLNRMELIKDSISIKNTDDTEMTIKDYSYRQLYQNFKL